MALKSFSLSQLTLGSVTKHTRDKYFRNDSNPHFYQTFTFVAQLPEDSRLLLEVLDYDAVPEVKNLTQGRIGDDLVKRSARPQWMMHTHSAWPNDMDMAELRNSLVAGRCDCDRPRRPHKLESMEEQGKS
jgi:hypothetical protein